MPSPVKLLTVTPVKAPNGYKLDHYAVGDGLTYREFPPNRFRMAVRYWASIGTDQPLEAWASRGAHLWQRCVVTRPVDKTETPAAWWTAWEHV